MIKTTACAIILIFALSIVDSYGQSRKSLDSWIGTTRKSLLGSWGLPEKEGDDGDGGSIMAYKTTDMRGTKWTSFYINENGIVYKWSTNPIPPQTIYVQPVNNRIQYKILN